MKQTISIEGNQMDFDALYDVYYRLKNFYEFKGYQEIKFKINVEIEVI